MEDVKNSEESNLLTENDEVLGYDATLLDKKVSLFYNFYDNKLIWTTYELYEEYSNKNDYLADYKTFKEALIKKYGKPEKDYTFWENDVYKDTVSNWGLAISIGHLVLETLWDLEKTEIMLQICGNNFEITCFIQYKSKELVYLLDEKEEQNNLDDL